MAKRKTLSASFKSKVALEAIKGEMAVAELAAKYDVHPTMVTKWKKQAIKGMADTFFRGGRRGRETFDQLDKAEERGRQLLEELALEQMARNHVTAQCLISIWKKERPVLVWARKFISNPFYAFELQAGPQWAESCLSLGRSYQIKIKVRRFTKSASVK